MMSTITGTDEKMSRIYETYSTRYENIMDRRFHLLTLVPGSTVAGFAIPLVADTGTLEILRALIFPLGLAGVSILIGLFMFIYVSLIEARAIAGRIEQIEKFWGVPGSRLYESQIFQQKIAIVIIFSASLAGWVCVCLWFALPGLAIYVAIASFFVLLVVLYGILANERLQDSMQAMFLQSNAHV